MKTTTRRTSGGYTPIEILVAAIFLLAVLTPVLNSLFGTVKSSANAEANTRAMARGRELMDRIRSYPWDENGSAPLPVGARSAVIGTEPGEASVMLFDDLDDFDGYMDEVDGYRRSVLVDYVQMTGAFPTYGVVTSVTETDFKRIRIQVVGKSGQEALVTDVSANTVP